MRTIQSMRRHTHQRRARPPWLVVVVRFWLGGVCVCCRRRSIIGILPAHRMGRTPLVGGGSPSRQETRGARRHLFCKQPPSFSAGQTKRLMHDLLAGLTHRLLQSTIQTDTQAAGALEWWGDRPLFDQRVSPRAAAAWG